MDPKTLTLPSSALLVGVALLCAACELAPQPNTQQTVPACRAGEAPRGSPASCRPTPTPRSAALDASPTAQDQAETQTASPPPAPSPATPQRATPTPPPPTPAPTPSSTPAPTPPPYVQHFLRVTVEGAPALNCYNPPTGEIDCEDPRTYAMATFHAGDRVPCTGGVLTDTRGQRFYFLGPWTPVGLMPVADAVLL